VIYAVKYLGIVDGSMAILSRKMAMQNLMPQMKLPYVLPKERRQMKMPDKSRIITKPVLNKPYDETLKEREVEREKSAKRRQKSTKSTARVQTSNQTHDNK